MQSLQNCKTESPFQNVESRTCYTREVLPCTDYDTSRNHLRLVFSDSCLELIRETATLIIRVEIKCMYLCRELNGLNVGGKSLFLFHFNLLLYLVLILLESHQQS